MSTRNKTINRTTSLRKTLSDYDYSIKCIVLGDSGVGKTSLLQKMEHDKHALKTTPTVEGIYHAKRLTVNNRKIQLSIWDTAGQEAYRSVTRIYYRGASCAIVIYDITRRSTFDGVSLWLEDLKNNCTNSNMVLVLVANKCDLTDDRVVSQKEGELLAKRHHMSYLEASAERCNNVQGIFELVSQEIYNCIKIGSIVPKPEFNGIKVGRMPPVTDLEGKKKKKAQSCSC